MHQYSHFFQTLHDEKNPVGILGRGTHYSVFRAVVWHDELGKILDKARFHDFAVIWDEDHDERVIQVVERLYQMNLLPMTCFIGERKGCLSLIMNEETKKHLDSSQIKSHERTIKTVTPEEDYWTVSIMTLSDGNISIINDHNEKVIQYLSTISMLWKLGSKTILP